MKQMAGRSFSLRHPATGPRAILPVVSSTSAYASRSWIGSKLTTRTLNQRHLLHRAVLHPQLSVEARLHGHHAALVVGARAPISREHEQDKGWSPGP